MVHDEIICICGSAASAAAVVSGRLGDVDGEGQRADRGAAATILEDGEQCLLGGIDVELSTVLGRDHPAQAAAGGHGDLRVDGLLVDRIDEPLHGIGNRGLVDVEGVRDAVVGAEASATMRSSRART